MEKCPYCSFILDPPDSKQVGKAVYCPYCYKLLAEGKKPDVLTDAHGKSGHIEIRNGQLHYYQYGGNSTSIDLEELRQQLRDQEKKAKKE